MHDDQRIQQATIGPARQRSGPHQIGEEVDLVPGHHVVVLGRLLAIHPGAVEQEAPLAVADRRRQHVVVVVHEVLQLVRPPHGARQSAPLGVLHHHGDKHGRLDGPRLQVPQVPKQEVKIARRRRQRHAGPRLRCARGGLICFGGGKEYEWAETTLSACALFIQGVLMDPFNGDREVTVRVTKRL